MTSLTSRILSLMLFVCVLLAPDAVMAQRKKKTTEPAQSATLSYADSLYQGLEYRLIGPFRGGRSCAVTGVAGKPQLFYFGSTGGGVWRTKDGGSSWENISDGFFGGSIGAVAVSEWDNNVIYAGGGEKTVRGNVSYGYGIWKTLDAGKTWTSMGLEDSRHISRIRIHPKNPDLVYAAVMGDLYQSSETRGVYRSKDGGSTWQRVLFANADAGAVDLVFDPNNPRILYASTWRVRRTPYSLDSGGEGSDLWKSTDGGDTWTQLTGQDNGLPTGTLGIIGVAVSPANSERIWALLEHANGGLYRSDNAGKSWRKVNEDRSLRQRAWYYTRIYADTQDENVVYVLNVSYHKSTDGGRTFVRNNAPHGDHHDLWIAPEDPSRMIIGDDGGAQITYDGGENWSTYYNQPTAQFYRVVTDRHFPYRIYAAQQDNSTVRIAHRSNGYSISEDDWESTAGGESAHIAPDPEDPEIVYGGSYGGFLTRENHRTGESRAINVWPDNPMGYGAEGMKYRFQWNFPIFFSPHNSKKLYACSNQLHVTYDEGQSWETISPDLTRNDSAKLVSSGGPITKDNTGVEYYCTIFAAVESPHEAGVIWTGSDDGLIHLTKDGGKTWTNVTPAESIMPAWIMINSLEVDPFDPAGLYVAATSYKSGDYRPFLYRTKDYGATWQKITTGIKEDHFTRVLRADPARKGLLYAGTESGMYISFDDGASFAPFQLNLPIVPITDLTVRDNNLIVATQGRSLWIIDDLSVLHQLDAKSASWKLYQPLDSYRMDGGGRGATKTAGANHPGGVMTYFYLPEIPHDSVVVTLSYLEADGDTIQSWTRGKSDDFPALSKGLQRFVWNMRYEDAKEFDGMILWWGQTSGPKAVPGAYEVHLQIGTETQTQAFNILKNPASEVSEEDMAKQFAYLMQVRDKLTQTHEAIIDIRAGRGQIKALVDRLPDGEAYQDIRDQAEKIDSLMTVVETSLYQTKNRSNQDPLNFPIRLNNKLAHLGALTSMGDYQPTDQALAFLEEVSAAIDEQLSVWKEIVETEVPAFNALVKAAELDAIRFEE
ncbi:MAG: glycosyl hydrolase [Bacteroidia bacterium]|nr:glycosyl hydrolase [Bacteroidia bacterium]